MKRLEIAIPLPKLPRDVVIRRSRGGDWGVTLEDD